MEHMGIVKIVQQTNLDFGITVLHEQWMWLGMQKHTHIILCNLDTSIHPYSSPPSLKLKVLLPQ